jgi:hypothetical protein
VASEAVASESLSVADVDAVEVAVVLVSEDDASELDEAVAVAAVALSVVDAPAVVELLVAADALLVDPAVVAVVEPLVPSVESEPADPALPPLPPLPVVTCSVSEKQADASTPKTDSDANARRSWRLRAPAARMQYEWRRPTMTDRYHTGGAGREQEAGGGDVGATPPRPRVAGAAGGCWSQTRARARPLVFAWLVAAACSDPAAADSAADPATSAAGGLDVGAEDPCAPYRFAAIEPGRADVEVVVRNATARALYVASPEPCADQWWGMRDAAGVAVEVTKGECERLCSDVLFGLCPCLFHCAAAPALRLEPGAAIAQPWDGRVFAREQPPESCLPAITADADKLCRLPCLIPRPAAPGSYTLEARAFSAVAQCDGGAAGCDCSPDAAGVCEVLTALALGGDELRAQAPWRAPAEGASAPPERIELVLVEPAASAPSGAAPGP